MLGDQGRVEAEQVWRPKKNLENRGFTMATRGVLQGCALVPQLFSGFIKDLESGDQGDDNIY